MLISVFDSPYFYTHKIVSVARARNWRGKVMGVYIFMDNHHRVFIRNMTLHKIAAEINKQLRGE